MNVNAVSILRRAGFVLVLAAVLWDPLHAAPPAELHVGVEAKP